MPRPPASAAAAMRRTGRRRVATARVGLALLAVAGVTAILPGNPVGAAAPRRRSLLQPNSQAPKATSAFVWGAAAGGLDAASSLAEAMGRLPLKNGLFTLLIIGSDARPGQAVVRSRGDSVHLLVFNPAKQKGTLIGFPRDSYVEVAGHGKAKLTASLAWGGPELMTATVSSITKIPVTNYLVTGFAGFASLIDAVGGVNVLVDPKMNDHFSGATFAKGWFMMNGAAALAFNRDRHDVVNGDFGRSANQGKFVLHALTQMRASATDNRGLLPWVAALKANTTTNLPLKDLLVFAEAARGVSPGSIESLVVPGGNGKIRVGRASQDVVLLRPGAYSLFADVAADGVRG
jgi:polyisoprenyl-teichoic acid--peptidoglycan teichoic acid transferase